MSTPFSTAMAFDRYILICRPKCCRPQTKPGIGIGLFFFWIFRPKPKTPGFGLGFRSKILDSGFWVWSKISGSGNTAQCRPLDQALWIRHLYLGHLRHCRQRLTIIKWIERFYLELNPSVTDGQNWRIPNLKKDIAQDGEIV